MGFSLPVGPPWGIGKGGHPPVGVPSSGEDPIMAGLNLQIPLPQVFPIPDAKEFNVEGHIAGTGITAAPIAITNATFTIPDSTFGRLSGVTLYVNDMTPTTAISWTVFINQGSPSGFTAMTMFPRAATSVSNSFDAFVLFEGPAIVKVVYSQTDAGLNLIGAAFSGWFWPKASDRRWKATGQ